jgi:hypothetical protein
MARSGKKLLFSSSYKVIGTVQAWARCCRPLPQLKNILTPTQLTHHAPHTAPSQVADSYLKERFLGRRPRISQWAERWLRCVNHAKFCCVCSLSLFQVLVRTSCSIDTGHSLLADWCVGDGCPAIDYGAISIMIELLACGCTRRRQFSTCRIATYAA